MSKNYEGKNMKTCKNCKHKVRKKNNVPKYLHWSSVWGITNHCQVTFCNCNNPEPKGEE